MAQLYIAGRSVMIFLTVLFLSFSPQFFRLSARIKFSTISGVISLISVASPKYGTMCAWNV